MANNVSTATRPDEKLGPVDLGPPVAWRHHHGPRWNYSQPICGQVALCGHVFGPTATYSVKPNERPCPDCVRLGGPV